MIALSDIHEPKTLGIVACYFTISETSLKRLNHKVGNTFCKGGDTCHMKSFVNLQSVSYRRIWRFELLTKFTSGALSCSHALLSQESIHIMASVS